MLALLSYPALFEPQLTLKQQAWVWSIAFGAFALVCGYTAWSSLRGASPEPPPTPPMDAGRPLWRDYAGWVLFAGCPSILLLTVTAHASMDIAPVPFLWIVPLALYLLSFILCFEAEGWYRRIVFLPLTAPALAGMLWLYQSDHGDRRMFGGACCSSWPDSLFAPWCAMANWRAGSRTPPG